MLAVIGAGIQLILLLLQKWFKFSDEQKQKAKEILNEVPHAKDVSSITLTLDRINRL